MLDVTEKPLVMNNQLVLMARHGYRSCPGGVVLPTGERRSEYVDCMAALGRPNLLASVARDILAMSSCVNAIGGLEGAGAMMASAASLMSLQRDHISSFLVRRDRISDQNTMYLQGSFREGDAVTLVDGLVRIGDLLRQAIEACQKKGLRVVQIVALVNDHEEVDLQSRMPRGCRFTSLCTLQELREVAQFTSREQDHA